MRSIGPWFAAAALVAALTATTASARIFGGCKFSSVTLQFKGTDAEQAACLLQKVKPKGTGSTAQPVPQWLLDHIGKPVDFTALKVVRYLAGQNINSDDVGGGISVGNAPDLRYFVIHDTSFPEHSGAFPANIDAADYSGNRLDIWGNTSKKVHLIIARDGRSRTFNNWGARRELPGVKIETMSRVPQARKHFAHVENVQPRIKPPTTFAWIAPEPGFSAAQEQRLALAYVVASARAGRWLIPAYHFNIDQGLPDGHDDPQNTSLESWAAKVAAIAGDIAKIEE